MMKRTVATLALFLWAGTASAQDRIPDEQAKHYAQLFVEQAKFDDPQIQVDADPTRPHGIRKGEIGALAMPDKRLTEEVLQKAGKDAVPVGQLWFRNLSPVVGGKPAPNARLRLATIKANDQEHTLVVFLLAARKSAAGDLELLVYGKDKKPLVVAPLKAAENKQEYPIELEGKKTDADTAEITLGVLGKYQAKIKVGAQEQ